MMIEEAMVGVVLAFVHTLTRQGLLILKIQNDYPILYVTIEFACVQILNF